VPHTQHVLRIEAAGMLSLLLRVIQHLLLLWSTLACRYLRVLTTVTVSGRAHVNEGITLYNLETLQSAPENAAAAEQRTATLPPLLNLSAQQMDIISAGVQTCEGLVAQLRDQKHEVMKQMEAACAAADTFGGRAEDCAQPGSCSSGLPETISSGVFGALSTFQPRQQHLEAQQRLAARLKLLMAKE
jgi:hypothetical protein